MWKTADQGWGGDAYPGEEPETQAVNEQSRPRRDWTEQSVPDPAEYHSWVYINGHIVMDSERDANQLVEDHGHTNMSKPLAYGRVAVQHRWTAHFQIDHTNISPYLVIKALKAYAKEQGWNDLAFVDHHAEELRPPVTANDVGTGWQTRPQDWTLDTRNPNSDQQDGEFHQNPAADAPRSGLYECPDCGLELDNYPDFRRHLMDEKSSVVPDKGPDLPDMDDVMPGGWNNSTSPDWVRIMSSEHEAGLTDNKLLEKAQGLPQDQSIVDHEFPDGWSIRRLRNYGDAHREGELMGNCFSHNFDPPNKLWWDRDEQYGELIHPDSRPEHGLEEPDYPSMYGYQIPSESAQHGTEADIYSLRDHNNLPHLTWEQDDDTIHDLLGRHNSDPKMEHIQRVQDWMDSDEYGWGQPERIHNLEHQTLEPWSEYYQRNRDYHDRTGQFGYMARTAAPKVTPPGPIPFIFDIERDRVYVGFPGEEVSDVNAGDYNPLGIVEGLYKPTGEVEITTQTNMPYTIRHMIQLWYYLHPELEVKSVVMVWQDGNKQKLASRPFDHRHSMALRPEDRDSWIEKNGPHMVHWTKPENVADIMKNGLVPWNQQPGREPNWGGYTQTRRDHVYMGTPGVAATSLSDLYSYPIHVDLRKLDPSKLKADEDQMVNNWTLQRKLPDDQRPPHSGDYENGGPSLGEWAETMGLDDPDWTYESLQGEEPREGEYPEGALAHEGVIPPEALSLPWGMPKSGSTTQTLWRGLSLGAHTWEEVQAMNADPLTTIKNAMATYQNVGIHWTDDPTSAENFALNKDPDGWAHESMGDDWGEEGGGDIEVGIVLQTEVDSSNVLEVGSEEHDGYQMTNAILDYGTEREVTVRGGAPITVHSGWIVWSGDHGGISKEITLNTQHTAAAPDNVGEKVRAILKTDPSAVAVYDALAPLGNVYVVGGAIRDLALGLIPKDIDIMAQGITPENVIRALKRLPGHVEVTGNQFPVIRYFHPSGEQCEVALPRREESTGGGGRKDFNVNMDINMPVEEDLERRDFTGNSMAVDLKTGKLIDPYGGWADLEAGKLSMVHPRAFQDDATRILRGLSSKSRHGLHPDDETKAAMSEFAHRIDTHVPNEQKSAELEKLLKGNDPASAIELAQETGVLKHILPEVSDTHGFDQKSKYHNKLLFDHIMEVLRRTAELNKDPDVRMAALLHDIGKPGSQWFDDEGLGHYYEKHFKPDPVTGERQPSIGKDHEHHGADLARDRLKELTWGNRDRQERVEHLVRSHMFDPFKDEKGARKFLNKYDPDAVGHAEDLMDIREADSGQKAEPWDGDSASQRALLKTVREQGVATNLKGLALNGQDVMNILGIKPGKEVGEHLQRLQEIVLEEPALNTRENLTEALQARQARVVMANVLDPIQDTLDADVFDQADKAKPKVKPHITEWVRQKVNSVLRTEWQDVIPHTHLVMTGSLTSFQWSHKSDFDVSVWFDYDQFPNLVRAEMIGLMVTELDGTLVPGTTHVLQCYVVPSDVTPDDLYKPGLRSAYDLDKNKWIVAPERDRVYNPYTEIPALMGWIHDQAEKLKVLQSYDPPGAREFERQIHDRRRRDQKAGKGDFSESNVLWKYLEHMDLV